MAKRGEMSMTTLVVIILLVVFLIAGIGVLAPLFTSDVQFSIKEQVCRVTLTLSYYFSFPVFGSPISAVCSADRVPMTSALINKYKEKTETPEDATMRFVLEKMRRCGQVYDLKSRKGLTKQQNCYVCYSLEQDRKDPLQKTLTMKQFDIYSLETQSPRGKSYIRELQEGNHQFFFALGKEGTFTPAQKDYAIVYQDNVRASDWIHWLAASGAAICVLGIAAAPISAGATLSACSWVTLVGGAVVGEAYAWSQTGGTDLDTVILTELSHAEQYCTEIKG